MQTFQFRCFFIVQTPLSETGIRYMICGTKDIYSEISSYGICIKTQITVLIQNETDDVMAAS